MLSALDAVRRQEYTGEGRCWPCTVLNGLVLAVASAGVALVDRTASLLLFALGVGLIAVRGYLVPYTPQFAPEIAARLPFDIYDERGPSDSLGTDTDGEEVLANLMEAGVVVADGETLYLADEFREDWRSEIATLRELDNDRFAAAVTDAAPRATGARVERRRGRTDAVVEPDTGSVADERRLSYPVALAEVGAVRALGERVSDPALRAAAAQPLRTFLETCPACGGAVEETTAQQCCGAPTNPRQGPQDVLACADCGERLYTF
jgi:hypothetical protein